MNDAISNIEDRADGQCSAHAWMRDKLRVRSKMLDYTLVAVAVYLTLCALAPDDIVRTIAPPISIKIWLGVLGAIVLFGSIVELVVDWKKRAGEHALSVRQYAGTKLLVREMQSQKIAAEVIVVEAQKRYNGASESAPVIPEDSFIAAMRHHHLKKAVSAEVKRRPGAWPLLIQLRMVLFDNIAALRQR